MLLEIALLSKPHAAADLLACVRLVLGVAPQMREVLAEGRNYAGAALVVAGEDLELALGGRALDVINGIVERAGDVTFVTKFHQVPFVVLLTRNFGGFPVGLNFVLGEEGVGEDLAAGLVLEG